MDRLQTGLLGAALFLAAMVSAQAQESQPAPSPFFDCPYVNYFDKDCPQLRGLWEDQQRRRLLQEGSPAAVPPGRDAVAREGQRRQEDEGSHDPDNDETYLLFPRESLAPDAPPLFRLLLTEPTLDNARRYVRWYARRTARLQAVQALIRLAGNELQAETGGSGERQP